MKKVIAQLVFIFLLTMNSLEAQPMKVFTTEDAALLCGSWKGSLTYLDYTSGKPYTMPANTVITQLPNSNHLLEQMIYPDEPKANSKDTILINAARTSIDGSSVVSRKLLPNGAVEIITERRGLDGNDNKKAIIRKTYTISKTQFINRKDVQFEGTSIWINRHEYRYNR